MLAVATRFLGRLTGVHASGWKRWRADCPACRAPDALVVQLNDYGTLGVECESVKKCKPLAVLEAVRLDVSALFNAEGGELSPLHKR